MTRALIEIRSDIASHCCCVSKCMLRCQNCGAGRFTLLFVFSPVLCVDTVANTSGFDTSLLLMREEDADNDDEEDEEEEEDEDDWSLYSEEGVNS